MLTYASQVHRVDMGKLFERIDLVSYEELTLILEDPHIKCVFVQMQNDKKGGAPPKMREIVTAPLGGVDAQELNAIAAQKTEGDTETVGAQADLEKRKAEAMAEMAVLMTKDRLALAKINADSGMLTYMTYADVCSRKSTPTQVC